MSTPEKRAKRAAVMRDWNRRNAERLRSEQRQRYRTDHKYRIATMGRARLNNLRDRGGLCDASAEYVPALLADPCSYCGEPMTMPGRIVADGASVDHIDPSGDSHWSNLTGCCSSCNAKKGEMPLLLSMLECQLRRDILPVAEQIWLIKGAAATTRRRLEFRIS